MCVNICIHKAIEMKLGDNDFYYPVIDETRCIACGLCQKRCPANDAKKPISNVQKVIAAWNKNKSIRRKSTSGGIFSLLAKYILLQNGYVVGVVWDKQSHAMHTIISDTKDLPRMYNSKYVQSHTNQIYSQVKKLLDKGTLVLFSGTPCQNSALKHFLGKDYPNLYQLDLVCHGVPSEKMLFRYLKEISNGRTIKNVRFRNKNPYWNYCDVTIDFTNGEQYSVPTVDDPYFTVFNIGYSLRKSCRQCQFTNLQRQSDLTLSDFWGFQPKSFGMRDYNKGISCILINSEKGQKLFEMIEKDIVFEERTIEEAKKGNKSLYTPYTPYTPDKKKTIAFWKDYSDGMSVKELCDKYVPNRFVKPKLLWLRNQKNRYAWLIKRK